jgi:hypothetical protein
MQEKYGFVYIWFDRKHKRYYVGCHWGTENDGYVCSSSWMKKAYKHRPQDFKRRILKTNLNRQQMYAEEYRWFGFIKPSEIKSRYYNLNLHQNNLWHSSDADKLTIGQKISASKKGKSSGPCSPEKAKAISEAKKKAFAERGGMSDTHKKAIAANNLGSKHTDEWKAAHSQRLKDQWSDGTRKKAELKITMTKEEQGKLHSQQLKQRWADPVWAEAQRAKLKAARNRRANKYNECSQEAY